MKDIVLLTIIVALLIVSLGGCSTTKVKRVELAEEIALTDRWNDTDSRLVAEEMVEDMLGFPWLKRYQQQHGENNFPTITIQRVQNKSHEHIAVETFVNDLKRSIIRSGVADFIVSGKEREQVREEMKQQDLYASDESRLEMGQEQGANYALSGSINSMVDSLDGKRVTFYQVDLKLIDMQSTREVWNGQKKIKKLQERSRFGL